MKRVNGRIVGQLTSQDWGTTLSFRKDGGVQTAKVKSNDQKTLGQTYQRLKMPNVAEFYKAAKKGLKDAFQEAAASLYAELIRYNITKEDLPVGLTRAQKAAGGCVVMPYLISNGSLPEIVVDDNLLTDIFVKGLPVATANTEIGALAKAIVEGNPGRFMYGDRISFFCFHQRVAGDTPIVKLEYCAVTLIEGSTEKLSSLASLKGFNVLQGRLAMSGQPPIGGYCWIHSRRDEETNELLLSKQSVITNNDVMIEMFTAPDRLRAAAESYGSKLEEAAVLDPTSPKTRRIARRFGIELSETASQAVNPYACIMWLEYQGTKLMASDEAPEIDLSTANTFRVGVNDAGLIDSDDLEVYVNGKQCKNVIVADNAITATMPETVDGDNLKAVYFTDGTNTGSIKLA